MPKFRDEAGNIWEDYGQGPVLVQAAQSGGPQTLAPPNPMQAPQLQRETNQAQASQYDPERARLEAELAALKAAQMRGELQGTEQERTETREKVALGTARKAIGADETIRRINEVRNLVRSKTATGNVAGSGLFQALPLVGQDSANLSAKLEGLKGGVINDMLQELKALSTSGSSGYGSFTETEADRLAASIAALSQKQDAPNLISELDRLERHYRAGRAMLDGNDPRDPQVAQTYGLQATEGGSLVLAPNRFDRAEGGMSAATGDTQAVVIPDEYQAEHRNYLEQNWGRLDPREYAVFRSQLDQRFGLNPDPISYANAVPTFNQMAAEGSVPGQLGSVPNPEMPLEGMDAMLNSAAQNPGGAFFANAGNALGAGLPAMIGGEQDKLGIIRDLNPGSSLLGEIAGGTAGSFLAGGGAGAAAKLLGNPRAAALLSNPLTADTAFSATYGASDGGATGAAVGAGGAIAGNRIGRAFGALMPDSLAPTAFRQAEDVVPTPDQLRQEVGSLYREVERTGQVAPPRATADMLARANRLLQSEGRMTPAGKLVDEQAPINSAMTMLGDYAGNPMTPTQAGAVRSLLSEGMGSPEPAQRRIAGMLTDEFDKWATPVLPGIEPARELARRGIEGRRIQQALDIAEDRATNFTQSGPENALRNAFRNLSVGETRGTQRFSPEVSSAIDNVVQGNPISNAARAVGKLAPTGAIPIGVGAGMGGLGYALGGTEGAAMLGGGAALFGSAGRRFATRQTEQAAETALNTAMGGPKFTQLLEVARELAARRGGSIGAGALGTGSVAANQRF
jgi:hypothetical protein